MHLIKPSCHGQSEYPEELESLDSIIPNSQI